jgi:hypothetical protein
MYKHSLSEQSAINGISTAIRMAVLGAHCLLAFIHHPCAIVCPSPIHFSGDYSVAFHGLSLPWAFCFLLGGLSFRNDCTTRLL